MAECLTVSNGGNAISVVNSRAAATLAAGATFQGTSEDVSGYGRVGIAVTSTTHGEGTLWIEVSHDEVVWSTIPRTWSDTRYAEPHMWNIVEKYFRIRYVNGSEEVAGLSIQVQYSTNANILLAHQLDGGILDETESLLTRSVLLGKDDKGLYQNVGIANNGKLQVESTDEFSHLLGAILEQQKKTNKYLQIISGYEMIDNIEDI